MLEKRFNPGHRIPRHGDTSGPQATPTGKPPVGIPGATGAISSPEHNRNSAEFTDQRLILDMSIGNFYMYIDR